MLVLILRGRILLLMGGIVLGRFGRGGSGWGSRGWGRVLEWGYRGGMEMGFGGLW